MLVFYCVVCCNAYKLYTKDNEMKQRQSGSAHVVVIIVLVLALAGALGWIFWQNFVTKPVQVADSSEKAVDKDVAPVESYKGVRTSSAGDAFSIKVPNGWKLMSNNVDDDAFGLDYVATGPGIDGKLDYDADAEPTVSQTELGGWGGFAEYLSIQSLDKLPDDSRAGVEFKLDDGTIGKKSETFTPSSPDNEMYPTTSDYYSHRYIFTKDTSTVMVNFGAFEEARNKYIELVENVVRTLQIR